MNVNEAIVKRREITRFQERTIPENLLQQLIQALYLAPSGNNIASREFIVVKDRSMLQRLSETTPYMKWAADAAVGFVIIGNPSASKYWLQDASIAGGYLWLSAVSLGLGAAWGAVYHSEDAEETAKRESHVRGLLNIPEGLRVVAVIGVGYAAEEPGPKSMYSLETVLHLETYRPSEH